MNAVIKEVRKAIKLGKTNDEIENQFGEALESLKKVKELVENDKNGFETVGGIKQTTNYDSLKFYKSNRALRRHKKNIVKSISENGNLTIGLVAKVKGIFYILDGQHRFESCKELGIPFEFKLISLATTNEMVRVISGLNSTSAKWKDLDYLEAWATEGKKAYKWLKEVNTEFSSVTFSNLKNIFGWKPSEFKTGNWSLDKTTFSRGVSIVRQLNDIIPILYDNGKINAQPMRAVIDAMKHDNYNHKKMVSAINNAKGIWNADETQLRTQLLQVVSNF